MIRSCHRLGCHNVMCSRYADKYGYICDECFEELVLSRKSVKEFMKTEKDILYEDVDMDSRRNRLDEIFKRRD